MSQLVGLHVEEGIGVVSLQDEAGKNAFSQELVAELIARLGEASGDPEVRVVVIRGLDDVFCAGGDQRVLLSLAEGRLEPYDLVLTRSLLDVRVPTIAAMAGHAVGGGLIFGLTCDLVVMGRESRYGCNFMELGFTPGMGTTRLLQAAVGEYVAAEMMFGCQYFKGSHFEGVGQVNYIVPRDQVLRKAMKVALRIADKPRFAIEVLKRTLSLPRRKAYEEALTMEALMHEVCFMRPETAARIRDNYTTTESEG